MAGVGHTRCCWQSGLSSDLCCDLQCAQPSGHVSEGPRHRRPVAVTAPLHPQGRAYSVPVVARCQGQDLCRAPVPALRHTLCPPPRALTPVSQRGATQGPWVDSHSAGSLTAGTLMVPVIGAPGLALLLRGPQPRGVSRAKHLPPVCRAGGLSSTCSGSRGPHCDEVTWATEPGWRGVSWGRLTALPAHCDLALSRAVTAPVQEWGRACPGLAHWSAQGRSDGGQEVRRTGTLL